jgi:hypothetical protein
MKSFSKFITEKEIGQGLGGVRHQGKALKVIAKAGKMTVFSLGDYISISTPEGNIKVPKRKLDDFEKLIKMAKKAK